MKPGTVEVNHTYWTIMNNQYGSDTTGDSILIVPVFICYVEREPDDPKDLGCNCVCASMDSEGKIPEPLPIRKVREAFLYETFEEAWGKLHTMLEEAMAFMDDMRNEQPLMFNPEKKDHILLIKLNKQESLCLEKR